MDRRQQIFEQEEPPTAVPCSAWVGEWEAALAHEEWWRVERLDPDQKCWFEIQKNYDSRDAAVAAGERMERRDGYRWSNWRVRHYDTRTYGSKPRHSPTDQAHA